MLPQTPGTHPSYNLLQEYFHFPEKFLFFNVKNISFPDNDDDIRKVDLLLPLGDAKIVDTMKISPDNFLLGCTPVINLFRKVTDPVRIDHTQYEYRLIPDERRERTTEIHSIQKVFTVTDGEIEPDQLASYFSYKHEDLMRDNQMYWVSRRANSVRADLEGTDVFVGFVDLNFNPVTAKDRVLYANTLCTNRILATQLPGGTELEIEEQPPISELYLLDRPTAQVYTPEDGATLWQIVSQLTINHLRVTEQENAAEALKETLRLYAGLHTSRSREIEAILDVKANPIVRRWGKEAWRGFVQGIGIELTMDEAFQSGNSAFLLAFVLQRYFALQVSINSFVELTLKSPERQDIWMRWQPHSGAQPLL
jgi:type VI secretion system protein ImpG